jgi:hypothetical protein
MQVLHIVAQDLAAGRGSRAVKDMNCLRSSDAVIVGSNATQDMNVWCVYVFMLYLCCPVFR